MSRRDRRTARDLAAGLIGGYLLDRAFGDPVRFHPVAGLGTVAAGIESSLYADSRVRGAVYAGVIVGGAAALGAVAERGMRHAPSALRVSAIAAATWATVGGTSLCRVADELADNLECGDLAGARALIPSLCGRDPQVLDADGMCRAAVESVAENTSDAVVGPLVWGAIAGLPGVLGYRAANTLDAMVGYRNQRYRRFGWASARFDDVLNLLPARLCATLTVILGGAPGESLRAWRQNAGAHPSPNAGPVEASFAGALGVRLGGRTVYPHAVEMRPELGSGPAPGLDDLRAAVRLSRRVQASAVLIAAGAALAAAGKSIREPVRRRAGNRYAIAESVSRRSVG